MKLSPTLKQKVRDQCRTGCTDPHCQDAALEIRALLFHTLAQNQVKSFSPVGQYRLNPKSIHVRPIYEIAHVNGRTLRIAFTRLSNIQTFSKRGRSTHCSPDEFANQLRDFLNSPPPATRQHPLTSTPGREHRCARPPTQPSQSTSS